MGNYISYLSGIASFQHAWAWIWIPLIAWSLIWKGWALWKSARAGRKEWFVVLLLVNTIGILDILYVYIFSKKTGRVKGENVS